MNFPATMRYGLLQQEKPADPPAERGYTSAIWRELDDLYRGGYQIKARAGHYIKRAVDESLERYQERLTLAAYIGYFGQIVNVYMATLFEQSVAVLPAGDADDASTPGELPDEEVYTDFARDSDLKGTAFDQVLRAVATTSVVKGKGLVAVDFPAAPGATVVSRADSDALGVSRPYIYEMQPEELIDWEYDDVVRRRVDIGGGRAIEFEVGRFSWAVRKRCIQRRASPTVERTDPVEEYTIWSRGDAGEVGWAIYRTRPISETTAMVDDEIVPLVASGVTRFAEIPIVEIRLPETMWLGNIIGPLNKEHWQRRSALLAAQQRSLLVIPTVYLGGELNGFQEALPAEAAQDPGRGNSPVEKFKKQGYLVLGEKDKLAFEGPSSDAYQTIDEQLDKLVDEIHRVSGRMAASISSTSTATGRSGASKEADNSDFITVCSALGAIIGEGAQRIYQVVSEARREDVLWTVHGLDGFEDGSDREAVIDELLALEGIRIRSRTAAVELYTRGTLRLLPGLDPETQAVVRKEIDDNTTAEEAEPPPKVEPIVPGQNGSADAEDESQSSEALAA